MSAGTHPLVRGRHGRGFTLIELIIVLGIISLLMAIVLPLMSRTLKAGRGFRCQMSLRSVAFDFTVFATDELRPDRGDDRSLGRRFRLETFQESLYGIDEFWAYGDEQVHLLPDGSKRDPMRCTEVRGDLSLLRGNPCTEALSPPQAVSYGFNSRLDRAEIQSKFYSAEAVYLTADVLQQTRVPLVWDVDGQVAFEKGVSPVFSAPALDSVALYAHDQYWFPGLRHLGQANFAFMDGHVEDEARPLEETGWDWSYQPAR